MMKKRIPVGVKNFDKLVEGGLYENSINLVAGGAGAGKTILSTQFLYNGAVKHKEPGVYVSFEQDKEKFFHEMSRFGWDLKKLEKDGKFIFLEYTPEKVEDAIREGSGIIESAIEKHKAKRLVIDSLTAFALLHKNELEKRGDALALFRMINKWGCTALLTLEHESGMDHFEHHTTTPLEFEADSLTLLYNIRDEHTRMRAIEILKMRGTNHSTKIYPMEINDKGIKIHLNKPLFKKQG